jgi:hypothetical protein
MELQITPFKNSHEYSLEIREFEPSEGYEEFLKKFCQFTGAQFLDWYQGWWDGLGHIEMNNQKLSVYWSDFPLAISFDCDTRKQAEKLEEIAKSYFRQNSMQSIPQKN